MGERPTSASRPRLAFFCLAAALSTVSLALAACGGGGETQAANEPRGKFEVAVTQSKFPTSQELAQTSDLIIGVKNISKKTIPELAFTIETDDGECARQCVATASSTNPNGSFSIRVDERNLSDPTRPVWILENKYPRPLAEDGGLTPPPSGLSGGFRVQTNTFGFGELKPGQEKTIVWRVTPVMAGTYTLHYEVEAGLDGLAKAVTADGGDVKGEFVVTIDDEPAEATVDDAGNVVSQG